MGEIVGGIIFLLIVYYLFGYAINNWWFTATYSIESKVDSVLHFKNVENFITPIMNKFFDIVNSGGERLFSDDLWYKIRWFPTYLSIYNLFWMLIVALVVWWFTINRILPTCERKNTKIISTVIALAPLWLVLYMVILANAFEGLFLFCLLFVLVATIHGILECISRIKGE